MFKEQSIVSSEVFYIFSIAASENWLNFPIQIAANKLACFFYAHM